MVSANPTRRVLVVEDDVVVADGLAELLRAFGYEVAVVHGGLQAMAAAEEFAAEVVVLDVHLPDIGGEVVYRLLRQRWPQMPVVFSSGHVRDLAEVTSGDRTRVTLLRKPYEGERLVEAIERLFAAR
jgi:DNA-binding response OmpR family regulator